MTIQYLEFSAVVYVILSSALSSTIHSIQNTVSNVALQARVGPLLKKCGKTGGPYYSLHISEEGWGWPPLDNMENWPAW